MSRLLTLDQIVLLRPKLKGVVLIGGVFDVLHTGHIEHIAEAKSLGKHLVVHITSDKRVRQKKGKGRPFFSENERAQLIGALRDVDYVFIKDVPHYNKQIIEAVRPDILFLNQEAVTDDIKAYISANTTTRVVISDAPKVNNSSDILKKL
ncbi:MAG: adenylyltransferase/cytidyltransferase family protein [Candidatus Saccharimonadales bacterium]